MALKQNNFNGMEMFKELKREGYQKKLWNGVHQEEENEEDLTSHTSTFPLYLTFYDTGKQQLIRLTCIIPQLLHCQLQALPAVSMKL
jgi:hypothetical protein